MATPQSVYVMNRLSKTYAGGKQVLKDITLAFLPGGDILITERAGRLRIVRKGVLDPQSISGIPAVVDLRLKVRRVRAVALNRELPIESNGRRRSFTVPRLQAYEVIIVE